MKLILPIYSFSACAFMLITHQEVHVNACTAIAVTRGASADNSTLIAHTDDAGGGAADLRLVRVPARDHESGSNRAVYNFNGGYPRVIAPDRGIYYEPVNDLEIGKTQEYTTPLGYIPQVEHTFAYFDQDYGMMNEKQLSIGESTCGAKTVGWPLNVAGGKNLFGIAELTKVALERCETARCAVDTMGTLAEKHGFYSEDSGDMAKPDFGDSAEALVVGDKFGEVWVFHVMTGKDHSGAVWAAQRVPDGHVTVIANGFTIREIDLSQRDWYMASSNVLTFAEEMGWWNPNGEKPFDFTAAYGFADKDAIGPLYTGRRVWRVFDILAPSLQLDARLGSFSQYATYPFSVRPDRFVETYQIMDLLRDHYKDTRYDMTKGLAAGPFGSPVRWSGSAGGVIGGWERPISMYRTLFAFVLQSRSHKGPDAVGGVAWYAQDAPHGSVFVPFSCAQESVPESYLLGRQSKFHPQSACKIDALQKLAFSLRNKIEMEAQYVHSVNTTHFVAQIESQSNKFAEEVVAQWWQLAWTLIAKYSDGYMTTGEAPEQQASIGYPAWWLQASEFATWPGDTFQPKASMLEMLVGVDSETAQNFVRQSIVTDSAGAGNFSGAIALGFIGAVLSVGILAFAKKASRRHRYNIVP
ncbi:peptidase [Plasmopara halstedii]|uniref:Peptidase n=1 Tax=Plasmopara halstedii TaxID=4781 RepID=A0A0P1AIQ7_PLAHL|nr:peptidase [Plasmopara halstedii]CEG40942.1 peptidase [Plasmopara halstedii]|eukprot:XP_024577311.1 peptidase [Plasmopara halstedii]